MKAISMLQPWAHAVVHLGKGVENRLATSSVARALRKHREPFLVHASATTHTRKLGQHRYDFTEACDKLAELLGGGEDWTNFRDEYLSVRMVADRAAFEPRANLVRGGIIGSARVVGVMSPGGGVWNERFEDVATVSSDVAKWHFRGQWGFVLADVRPLPFVPCKGMLGLWEVPDAVLDLMRDPVARLARTM